MATENVKKKMNMENIVLYVEPGFNNDYSVKQISSEKTSIIVGSGSDADIVYANSSIGKRQIELLFSDGKLHYKNLNPKVPVYINGKVYVEHDFMEQFDRNIGELNSFMNMIFSYLD